MSSVRVLVLVVVAALLASACSGTTAVEEPEDRVAAILAAREALGPVAADLGSAALTLGERFDAARERPAAPPVEGLRAAASDLADASRAAARVDAPGDAPDVRAAMAALERAANRGAALATRGTEAAALLDEVMAIDARLVELVATWDEPGSRSQQIERFATTAAEATALADELAARRDEEDGDDGCPAVFEVRETAARNVAAASEEFRDLVANRAGTTFDERRSELSQDPYGVGDELVASLSSTQCPLLRGVGALVEAVTAGLEDVEAALNPADLRE
jgi:hypothetical protein